MRLTMVVCFGYVFGWLGLSSALAQTPELVVSLPDTTLNPGQTGWLSIYLYNYDDPVAGVQFTLVSRDPAAVQFDLTGPYFDTAGTLLSGWELVDGYDTSGIGASLTLYGLANAPPDPNLDTPPVPVYAGGQRPPLIRFPVRTAESLDSTAITVDLEFEGLLEFSTPDARLIGVITELSIDTLYLLCLEREGDSCLEWSEVDPHVSAYDTVVVDSSFVGYLDTTLVVGQPGSVTILQTTACDITLDSRVTLTDLTCLVQFLFNQNDPPACLYYGNCNFADPAILNLTDITGLVQYLFFEGPPPQ